MRKREAFLARAACGTGYLMAAIAINTFRE